MQKIGDRFIAFVLVTGIFALLFYAGYLTYFIGGPLLSPPSTLLPASCSNADIQLIWETALDERFDEDVTIIKDSSLTGPCYSYLAYKLENDRAYVLTASSSNGLLVITHIFQTQLTSSGISYFTSSVSDYETGVTSGFAFDFFEDLTTNHLRTRPEIDSSQKAQTEFAREIILPLTGFVTDTAPGLGAAYTATDGNLEGTILTNHRLIGAFFIESNTPPASCGNGIVESGETCDDGNTVTEPFACPYGDTSCDQTCSSDCSQFVVRYAQLCGDGIKNGPEQCDDGNTNDTDACKNNCQLTNPPVCGNGVEEGTETCDDGNTVAGDGCSALCQDEPDTTCTWQPTPGACSVNDTRTLYFVNVGSAQCNLNTRPANQTEDYDCNGDGFIGNESSIDFDNFEGRVYVGNVRLSSLTPSSYGNEELIEIRDDDGNTIVEFYHDFNEDDPLNFREWEIITQRSSTNYGYVIENGIPGEKVIYVRDKSSADDDVLCYQESADSASDINPECDGGGEDILPCPGSDGDVDCEIDGGYYKVTGLEGTGVWELTDPSDNSDSCTPDWSGCGAWTQCTNGVQFRSCTDLNGCLTGTQQESQACTTTGSDSDVPLPGCTPNWECTDYPLNCPSDGIRRRTCTDLNSCGTTVGKPSETTRCSTTPIDSDSSSSSLLWIVLAFLVMGILAVVLIIFLRMKASHTHSRNTYHKPIIQNGQQRRPSGYQRPF